MISPSSEDPSLRLAHRLFAISIVFVLLIQALVPHQVHAQSSEPNRLLVEKRILLASAQKGLVIAQEKADSEEISEEVTAHDPRVIALRDYFTKLDMPAADYAEYFVLEADKNNLDWRLLPAITYVETTGCKYTLENSANSRENNCFGYGNMDFESIPHGISYVTAVLAGNNERMAYYYANKTLEEKLYAYNQVNPKYKAHILKIMKDLESATNTLSIVETV